MFNSDIVKNSKLANKTTINNLKYFYTIQVGNYSNPGNSCLDILQRTTGTSLSSGDYWIVLDNKPLKVYCDMKVDGGMFLRFLCSGEVKFFIDSSNHNPEKRFHGFR